MYGYLVYVICENGDIYAWGYNENGKLGLGHTNNVYIPTKITELEGKNVKELVSGWDSIYAICENSDIYAWGSNWHGQLGLGHNNNNVNIPTKITELEGKSVKELMVLDRSTYAICENGDMYACGYNYRGKLGLGHDNDVHIPTMIMGLGNSQNKKLKISEAYITCFYDQKVYILGETEPL